MSLQAFRKTTIRNVPDYLVGVILPRVRNDSSAKIFFA